MALTDEDDQYGLVPYLAGRIHGEHGAERLSDCTPTRTVRTARFRLHRRFRSRSGDAPGLVPCSRFRGRATATASGCWPLGKVKAGGCRNSWGSMSEERKRHSTKAACSFFLSLFCFFARSLALLSPSLPERRLSRSRGRGWGRRAAFFFVKLLLKPSCHLLVVGGPSLAHQSDQVRPRHDRNKTLKRISCLLVVGPGEAPEQVQVRRLALDLHIHGRSSS